MTQWVKNPPAMQETMEAWILSLGCKDTLEVKMATHSGILAWEIPELDITERLSTHIKSNDYQLPSMGRVSMFRLNSVLCHLVGSDHYLRVTNGETEALTGAGTAQGLRINKKHPGNHPKIWLMSKSPSCGHIIISSVQLLSCV